MHGRERVVVVDPLTTTTRSRRGVGAYEAMPSPSDVIVVVEDDPNIADLVDLYLRNDGFRVLQATTGERALELIAMHDPVLVVLDVGLPGGFDGLEVCRRIRADSSLPVVMLTARDDEIDRVLGLELGADDYVTKPFSPRELVARVHAILRRSAPADSAVSGPIAVGSVVVDSARHEVRVGETVVPLATQEFALLQYLVENRGRALSRRQLLDGAWGNHWIGDERTVDVHVRQLRRKLGDALVIDTVRGVGYRMS